MKKQNVLNQIGWWILFLVSAFYGLYALYMGALEILHQVGILEDVKFRAAPWIFIIHALAGSVGLSRHIVYYSLGTPPTNEHYLNATRGNIYGIEKSPTQVGPLGFRAGTEFDGLYLCG